MSLNPCIKTGANVWIDSHGAALHGDLYHVAGVYVLRYVGARLIEPKKCDAIFLAIEAAEATEGLEVTPSILDMNPFRSDCCGTIIIEEAFVKTELD